MVFFKSFFFNTRLFLAVTGNVLLFLLGFGLPVFYYVGQAVFVLLVALLFIDIVLLYGSGQPATATRKTAPRFSNGDPNPVRVLIENLLRVKLSVTLIDEVPVQFQYRNMRLDVTLKPGERQDLSYTLRPVKRGVYEFGKLNLLISTPIGLGMRKVVAAQPFQVAVYPSFLQMHRYELMAHSQNLVEAGIKKIRKIGHNMEFEQIKEYVPGDDYRALNWKATARKGDLMVNQYEDEKSQQVYSLIDKGRTMQMPFGGMALLDYAINTSLAIANIAMKKQDKAGLITFNKGVNTFLPASKKARQLNLIMERLYAEKTAFRESDMERLYAFVKRKVRQRSLILFYTNFETYSGMERQLNYLRLMAKGHLVVVIFFVNTEIQQVLSGKPSDTEGIYVKTIAEKVAFEKRQIIKGLQQHGIQSILTEPDQLTPNTINKYLELKARNLI